LELVQSQIQEDHAKAIFHLSAGLILKPEHLHPLLVRETAMRPNGINNPEAAILARWTVGRK
jgi:hypothetical protein